MAVPLFLGAQDKGRTKKQKLARGCRDKEEKGSEEERVNNSYNW